MIASSITTGDIHDNRPCQGNNQLGQRLGSAGSSPSSYVSVFSKCLWVIVITLYGSWEKQRSRQRCTLRRVSAAALNSMWSIPQFIEGLQRCQPCMLENQVIALLPALFGHSGKTSLTECSSDFSTLAALPKKAGSDFQVQYYFLLYYFHCF